MCGQNIALTKGYDSPLGKMTLAERDGKLIGAWFDGQKHDRAHLDKNREARPGEASILDEATRWLDSYFSGKVTGQLPPLAPVGTKFQQDVWHETARIPCGKTLSYGQIAKNMEEQSGQRESARAVGAAVGRNPLLIFVPCHRVVGADGSLTGYAGGLKRKQSLLDLEHTRPSSLCYPHHNGTTC
jgi:methylated-DNA-[protein]-cysteine S-methyltransferase